MADPEKTDQRIYLVCQGNRQTFRGRGQAVLRALRAVMIRNGKGDFLIQPVMLGIMPAHNPLQFGKFAHHAGNQIGLGQPRRLCRRLAINPRNMGRQCLCQLWQAAGLVTHRAQPLIKGDLVQPGNPFLQTCLFILLPEKGRIRQAGAQDAFIACRYQLVIFSP